MLARTHRFHGHNSLNYVYRQGANVRSPFVMVRYARNPRLADYRVAVIVSRKVHKAAVQRNRVRRRIYEIVRTGRPITGPFDIVITVFSDQVVDMPATELTRLIEGLLKKARVYDAPQIRPTDQRRDIVESREENR